MEIAIVHDGKPSHILPSTCILKRIVEKYPYLNITWVSKSEYVYILQHNKHVSKSISIETFLDTDKEYDLMINLFPSFIFDKDDIKCSFKNAMGFYFDHTIEDLKDILIDEKISSDMNVYQVYYRILGAKWRGEGCDISYYPRSKQKKNRIGVSVANSNLRNYILDNLELDNSRIWYIPYRKNIFKRMDEINKCSKIITDDLLTLYLATILRKYVYFLETFPLSMKLEFFGMGETYKVKLVNI